MPLATAIELDGAGSMLAPGTYVRRKHGAAAGRGGRVAVRDFAGVLRRALQVARDTAWDATGVGPAYEGQGMLPTGGQ